MSTQTLRRRMTSALVVVTICAWTVPEAFAAIPGGTLDPNAIEKYDRPLVIPPAMPATSKTPALDYYEIAVRQFQQQVLPVGWDMTTVWSYGSVTHPETFHYPAFTIEASFQKPVRVKWINDLVDESGDPLPHLLPVDPTLHWANPPGPIDTMPMFESTPGRYTGPVPIVVHLHGGHSDQESDGYPEAWYLPAGADGDVEAKGTWYETFKAKFLDKYQVTWDPGTATFQYDNDQAATTLWYHDHTLGMTRLNVYAGPAGFYLLRGGPNDLQGGILPGPAPAAESSRISALPSGVFEIPVVIQDRSFNDDGSLFYPESRSFFDPGLVGPYIPLTDISPIWNPEFFGNTMVVNGRTWPFLEVEKRRYRLRFLNGSNSRFLILTMSNGMRFWQIGADGGFLPTPVELEQLLLGPAERADVIVDFTSQPPGTEIILKNLGPDEPFGGGVPGVDFEPADPATTGQVMKFVVTKRKGWDGSLPPQALVQLGLPSPAGNIGDATRTRQVSLNEELSSAYCSSEDEETGTITLVQCETGEEPFGPRAALLGTVDFANSTPQGVSRTWDGAITENPALNSVEVWEIYNFTEDAHPIHIHEIQFEVVDRQPFPSGPARPPEIWETGQKDTVIAYPGEVTRVKAEYDRAGLFVWHCHILEHEDNEMMRPYCIGDLGNGQLPEDCGTPPSQ